MPNAATYRPDLADTELPAIIVLGRDDTNKPHASWFGETEAEQARAAAKAMGMIALSITTDDLQGLAAGLPHGKIFASGKAFVPFTKQVTYDALIAHVPVAEQVRPLRVVRAATEAEGNSTDGNSTENKSPAVPPANDPGAPTMPQDWSKIGPGCIVLAISDDKTEGWFESVIVKAKGNVSFTLRWRDYPGEPHFERTLSGMALMHPSRTANA